MPMLRNGNFSAADDRSSNLDGNASNKRTLSRRQRNILALACAYGIEKLESRVMLAADFWTGANHATDSNWTDGANWLGGAAPRPGDDLVFPASGSSLIGGATVGSFSTVDNFNAGTLFNSITFKAGGYSVDG